MKPEDSDRSLALTEVLSELQARGRTGVLTLTAEAERGTIYLNRGLPIDALLISGPTRQIIAVGDEALIYMFGWQSGSSSFQASSTAAVRSVRVTLSNEELRAASLRMAAAPPPAAPPAPSTMVNGRLITLTTKVAVNSEEPTVSGPIKLSLTQWQVLSQAVGQPMVHQIAEQLQIPMEQALHSISDMIARDLLLVRDPAPASDLAGGA
jgi:hypothetical protein